MLAHSRNWIKRLIGYAGWFVLVLNLSGCPHHAIKFEDIGYIIETQQQDVTLVVVIDEATRIQTVPIRSWMTGIAHSWDAQPGVMLMQVSKVELPQMFREYQVSSFYKEPEGKEKWVVLELTIPNYVFEDFHATVTVEAKAYGPGKSMLFERSYTKEGFRQGAKMFWAGAFGMKSSIRQSSFDAYKKVFVELRADLLKALNKNGV